MTAGMAFWPSSECMFLINVLLHTCYTSEAIHKRKECLMNTYANLGDRADLLDSITALEKELAAKTDKDIVLVVFSI